MNIPLIIITFLIVIIISYILSRPFLNGHVDPESLTSLSQYKTQYETLLGEIKNLEVAFKRTQDQTYYEKIEAKKEMAADLLRLIDQEQQQAFPSSTTGEAPQSATIICPHCGRRIVSGDKFCNYCGNRLQPK